MVQLLDLLFPKFCVGCGKIGTYFCQSCKKQIRYIQPSETICPVCDKGAVDGMTHPACRTRYSLDGLISVFHYDHVIKRVIKEIKYRFVSDIVAEMMGMVGEGYITHMNRIIQNNSSFLIIPIPLNPARKRFRGFNQAELIGKHISRMVHVPIIPDFLLRIRKTVPQVEMKDRDKRIRNMKNVFGFNPKHIKNIPTAALLVDDVFTTGATVSSACKILKTAGVQRVIACTIAR